MLKYTNCYIHTYTHMHTYINMHLLCTTVRIFLLKRWMASTYITLLPFFVLYTTRSIIMVICNCVMPNSEFRILHTNWQVYVTSTYLFFAVVINATTVDPSSLSVSRKRVWHACAITCCAYSGVSALYIALRIFFQATQY